MILDRFRLDNRVAVITGGGGGLGTLAALTFAGAGADIVLLGRNEVNLEATANEVRALGRTALPITVDVTDGAALAAAAERIEAELGGIDILFNNAGITSTKTLRDIPPEEWQALLDVNVTGSYLAIRAVTPALIRRGGGRIINMGSILSARGMANRVAYSTTKAAVANMAAALAFELGPHGITVNTLAPTVIVTDLNREAVRTQPELYEAIVKRTPLGRLGEPDDLSGALLLLASDAGRYMTGQTLFVDGGYTAG
ncbi:SDR family NAD(P)-dependent oxidoreductase [Oceanibacterium hippocampi]|uniref:2-dehydro-3-deoxy-D-gluconate 5-dehydrogenase n=1 Tax=Oceanibacterium hippocampi TaxID=745714 RepID=A0A1Y5TRT0_9PROT|nr:SDR family oxidoreductase [Oceanibacterium hippocampi]SLN70564.1 2-dehydro-3-deoxy-D-gluconate 5-dehydrogenase [Oceanibacterium hippocampi]